MHWYGSMYIERRKKGETSFIFLYNFFITNSLCPYQGNMKKKHYHGWERKAIFNQFCHGRQTWIHLLHALSNQRSGLYASADSNCIKIGKCLTLDTQCGFSVPPFKQCQFVECWYSEWHLWLIWEYCSGAAFYRKTMHKWMHSMTFWEIAGYADKR